MAGNALGSEEGGDLVEDLFHDRILAEVVVAAFEELFVFVAVGANSGDDFGHADSRGDRKFGGEASDQRNFAVVAIGAERGSECWRGHPLMGVEGIGFETLACGGFSESDLGAWLDPAIIKSVCGKANEPDVGIVDRPPSCAGLGIGFQFLRDGGCGPVARKGYVVLATLRLAAGEDLVHAMVGMLNADSGDYGAQKLLEVTSIAQQTRGPLVHEGRKFSRCHLANVFGDCLIGNLIAPVLQPESGEA